VTFDYPQPRAHRRHGPQGYANYVDYRPWLRDDFLFRCAYCLKREQWGQVSFEYDIDHFEPRSLRPDLALSYDNLLYACRRCNGVKRAQVVDDPFTVLVSPSVSVLPNGMINSMDERATRLIHALDLNSPRIVEWRIIWLSIVELARTTESSTFKLLLGFPTDLPDLKRVKPPPEGNTRPEGLEKSWAALAASGELPDYY